MSRFERFEDSAAIDINAHPPALSSPASGTRSPSSPSATSAESTWRSQSQSSVGLSPGNFAFAPALEGVLGDEGLLGDETGYGPEGLRVPDLDLFLGRVYGYYAGKGFSAIALATALQQLELLWVVALVFVMTTCVRYDVLFGRPTEEQGNISFFDDVYQCTAPPAWLVLCLLVLGMLYANEAWRRLQALRDYWSLKRFFENVLHISDSQLQTMDWGDLVGRLCRVPGLSPSLAKPLLSELDVCNRIMRRENIMIGMIDAGILNLRVPGADIVGEAINFSTLRKRQLLTQTVEWGLQRTLFNFVFAPSSGRGGSGTLNAAIRDPSQHARMAAQLRSRFRFVGVAALLASPFVFLYLVVYSLFQYGEELRHRPRILTARRWTALARWKFRQLNELPHVFRKRLNAANEQAEKYIEVCFPGNKLSTLARSVSFLSGSVVVVLLGLTVFGPDDEFLMNVEFHGKSGVWVLGMATAILAVSRTMMPEDSAAAKAKPFLSPAQAMERVVQHTHYFPVQWRGRTHTIEVKNEFTSLFTYSVVAFTIELVSVLLAPFVFMFSLPRSADAIVDYLRNHTVFVEGVGDVVDAATFPIHKRLGEDGTEQHSAEENTNMRAAYGPRAADDFFDKLEASFLSFRAHYPTWEAGLDGDDFLGEMSGTLADSGLSRHSYASPPLSPRMSQKLGSSDVSDNGGDATEITMRRIPAVAATSPPSDPTEFNWNDRSPSLAGSEVSLAEARRLLFRQVDRLD